MKFRRRVTEIEAYQFNPPHEVPKGVTMEPGEGGKVEASVVTIHGQKTFVVPGDWIVPEPDGIHFYPVKDEIMRRTYESVE